MRSVPASRILPVTGCILLTGPLFGLLGTIVGMLKAFSRLGDGDTDPSLLAGDISIALMTTIYGIVFGLVGVILVSIALFRRTNREQWFYRYVFVLSIFWCISLCPIGIYLLVVFCKRKNEFYPQINNLSNEARLKA